MARRVRLPGPPRRRGRSVARATVAVSATGGSSSASRSAWSLTRRREARRAGRAEPEIPAGGAERTALSGLGHPSQPPGHPGTLPGPSPHEGFRGSGVGRRAFGPGPTPGRPPAPLKRQRPGRARGPRAQTLGGAAPSGRGCSELPALQTLPGDLAGPVLE